MQWQNSSRHQRLYIAVLPQLCFVWPKGSHTRQAILARDCYIYMLTILYWVAKLLLTLNWRYAQMLLGKERSFFVLYYFILKFLRANLFLWGMKLLIHFFCSEYINVFLKMIKNLPWRHRLHFFVSIVVWFTIPEYYLLQVKGCVGMFEGRHMFGQLCLVSSVCMSEGCQVVFVPFVEVSG